MIRFFTLFCLLLFATPLLAHQLTWLVADAPPIYIKKGFYAGQGYWQKSLPIIMNELSQYTINEYEASLSRQYSLLKEEDEVCGMGFFRTKEREKFLLYSEPLLYPAPPVVVMRREKIAELGEPGALSIAYLLENNYLFGVSHGRSYGKAIDTLFAQHGNAKNIFEYEGANLSQSFLEMLLRGRIDALVLPATDYYYNGKILGAEGKLEARQIVESMERPKGEATYIVCSKTAAGEEAITVINSIVRRTQFRQQLAAAYERWLPVQFREKHRKKLREHSWYYYKK